MLRWHRNILKNVGSWKDWTSTGEKFYFPKILVTFKSTFPISTALQKFSRKTSVSVWMYPKSVERFSAKWRNAGFHRHHGRVCAFMVFLMFRVYFVFSLINFLKNAPMRRGELRKICEELDAAYLSLDKSYDGRWENSLCATVNKFLRMIPQICRLLDQFSKSPDKKVRVKAVKWEAS